MLKLKLKLDDNDDEEGECKKKFVGGYFKMGR